MCPIVTVLVLVTPCGYLTGGTPFFVLLEVLEFRTLFVGLDATLEVDLVLIDEKLDGGAFTFCFPVAGRECQGPGIGH